MGNRERIVNAAVELMNKNGSVVGTTQLTDHLSISPGNLYYHFRNREEILVEVLARLARDLDAVLVFDPKIEPDAKWLAEIFTGGARVLWRYRFFFSASLELVVKDPLLLEGYRAFCMRGIGQVDAILAHVLREHNGPVQIVAAERRKLAENMWVLWTSWPRYAELVGSENTTEKELLRNHEYLEFLLKPYLDPKFFRSVARQTAKLQKLAD